VLLNLFGNAVEVLLAHGIANPQIDVSARLDADQQWVVITIRDNGPGIHEKILTTLFDPFVTTQKRNGTGLGLAIVKQYITAHGGSIRVANEHGAVFRITLPWIALCD
jgi:two-component system NtrC family sensor kinase